MQLYAGTVAEFATDVERGRLLPQMREEFARQILSRPSASELRSWEVSLAAIKEDLLAADVLTAGVLVEYMLPLSSKRLDVLLFGRGSSDRVEPIVIELKQWTRADIDDVEGRLVVVGNRLLLHPQQQVAQYVEYLRDFHPMLYEGRAELGGAAYLHNASEDDVVPLRDAAAPDLAGYPLFTAEGATTLQETLSQRLSAGGGIELIDDYLRERARPSKKLLDHVAEEIEGHPEFTLLDDQAVAYEVALQAAEASEGAANKTVVIVTGGPGSGKSVIATRMLGDFARRGLNVSHATGSRSFTQTLRKHVTRRTSGLFRYFNSFMDAGPDELDVLICDEAHRMRVSSNSMYTPRHKRSAVPQVDELIRVARLPVFLLDENQIVRPDEIGTPEAIEEAAAKSGAHIVRVELDGQFRCMGSAAYTEWVARLLGIASGGPASWQVEDDFEVYVAGSPPNMEQWLADRLSDGHSARIAAGFCWPWSDPASDGTLIEDVNVDGWRRPWNAKPGKRTKGAPESHYWASDPRGFGQVGCIYTAQGFEYDYGGVIMGRDLVWRDHQWEANRDEHADKMVKRARNFAELITNVYKVLLTRSLRGCVIYSTDPETQTLLERLIARTAIPSRKSSP